MNWFTQLTVLLATATAHGLIPAPALAARGHSLRAQPAAVGARARLPMLCSGSSGGVGAALAALPARALDFADRQFFLVGVISAISAAAVAPGIGGRSPLLSLGVSWGAPFGIFLIAGVNMPTGKLAKAATRVRAHAAIQAFSVLLVPLLTVAVCTPLSAAGLLSPVIRDAFLVLSVLPTTVNMCVALSRAAGGDEALAVFNAVLGNLLGIFVTPLMLLLLLGRTGAVPIAATVRSLALKVLL